MASFEHGSVSVGVVQSPVVVGDSDGMDIVLTNDSSATIFLGSSGVLTSTGFPLGVGERLEFRVPAGVAVYGIADYADCVLHMLIIQRS